MRRPQKQHTVSLVYRASPVALREGQYFMLTIRVGRDLVMGELIIITSVNLFSVCQTVACNYKMKRFILSVSNINDLII